MDDLIVLLIRALVRWLGADAQKTTGRAKPATGAPPVPNVPPAWQEQIRRAAAAAKRPGKGRRPAPPPMPAPAAVKVIPSVPSAPIAAAAHASTRQAPSAARADIRHWLTPAILQRQFILTEVLQPPLALREKR